MTEQRFYPWQEGLPTGPDVALLQREITGLKPGDRIEYARVEALLGLAWRTVRFRTITNAWRRREFERGLVIDCDPGAAFLVLTADQISAKTYTAMRHAGHTVRKQRGDLATIRPENTETRQILVHQMTLLAQLERETKKARMNLLPGKPAEQPAQISPPNQEKKA